LLSLVLARGGGAVGTGGERERRKNTGVLSVAGFASTDRIRQSPPERSLGDPSLSWSMALRRSGLLSAPPRAAPGARAPCGEAIGVVGAMSSSSSMVSCRCLADVDVSSSSEECPRLFLVVTLGSSVRASPGCGSPPRPPSMVGRFWMSVRSVATTQRAVINLRGPSPVQDLG